jgi:pilus assembly protein CpaB
MRPSRIVLLLVAIVAGGLAAFLATRGNAPVKQVVTVSEVVQEKKEQILVAVAPIGVGQRLSARTVQWLDWPEGAVRPEYITMRASPDALDQLSGAVARFEIFPGDPILEGKLVRSNQGYLSAVLEKGRRGVSIAVTADSASGGFIVPNDHVDVVLTRSGDTGQVSETILHNVKVLAIGTRLGETGSTGRPEDPDDPRAEVFRNSAIATLDLDPVQGETVINASKIGSLSLVLRSIADFAADPSEVARRPSNQAVRMIKFGNEMSVMAGNSSGEAQQPVVNPAAFAPDPQFTFTPAPVVTVPPSQLEADPAEPAPMGQ